MGNGRCGIRRRPHLSSWRSPGPSLASKGLSAPAHRHRVPGHEHDAVGGVLCEVAGSRHHHRPALRTGEAHRAGNVTLMCIGKKGGEALKRMGYVVNLDLVNLTQNADAQNAFAAMQSVIDSYLAGNYDRVEVVYNKFKNAATQILVNEQLLPVAPAANVEMTRTGRFGQSS